MSNPKTRREREQAQRNIQNALQKQQEVMFSQIDVHLDQGNGMTDIVRIYNARCPLSQGAFVVEDSDGEIHIFPWTRVIRLRKVPSKVQL